MLYNKSSVENDPPPEVPRPLVNPQFAEIKARDKHIKKDKNMGHKQALNLENKRKKQLKENKSRWYNTPSYTPQSTD